MDVDTVVQQLIGYSQRHSGDRALLAVVTAKWLALRKEVGRVDEGMLEDPLIKGIVHDAAMETACGWRPASPPLLPSLQTIYCDGCCLGNGAAGARAGYGVHIADAYGEEVYSAKQRLSAEEAQTNQRAELQALHHALKWVDSHPGVAFEIYTDSRYAMDCVVKWAPTWESAGWRKSDNKPALHADVIQECLRLYRAHGDRVRLCHVEAHTGRDDPRSRGNAVADRYAREGAELTC